MNIPLPFSLAWLLALALAASACAQDKKPQPKLPDNIVVEEDLEYGKAGDRSLKLDMVRPRELGTSPRPVVAFIHGGGWRGGSKAGTVRGPLAILTATEGYVGVSIEYRLSGEAIWPAQIHDCKAAIRWLRANASKYNLDPDKIAVWGASAGGHLVSLLGTSGDVKELEGMNGSPEQSSRVTCVINFFGPSDFISFVADPGTPPISHDLVDQLFGGKIADKKSEAIAASPVTYASADDPPFLTVHGTVDNLVPLAQAKELDEALKKASVSSTLVIVEGGGHGFNAPEVNKRTVDFLAKHLKGKDVTISSEPVQLTAK